MHVVIINGSPRVQKYSNTDKIIAVFAKGLSEKGNTFEHMQFPIEKHGTSFVTLISKMMRFSLRCHYT